MMIEGIFSEIYLFLFISSMLFIFYVLIELGIKLYGRFKLGNETRFVLSHKEKIVLWVSLSIIFTYIL